MKTGIIIILLFTICNSIAQDIHFSQFNRIPLLINPASAGVFNGDVRASLAHKNQWNKIASAYKTYAVSLDAKILKSSGKENYLGIGLFAYADKAGAGQMGTTDVKLTTAYHLQVNNSNSLAVGIQGGYTSGTLKTNDFQWGNQYDGSGFNSGMQANEQVLQPTKGFADFNVGVLWSFNNSSSTLSSNDGISAQIGYSSSHVTSPSYSFFANSDEKLRMKHIVHGKVKIGINNSNLAIVPSGFFALQGGMKELVAGTAIRMVLKESSKFTGFTKETAISIGGYYRVGDAVIASLAFEKSSYTIGVSYDFNVSNLAVASSGRGGPEIVLRFINPNPFGDKKSNARFY